MAFCAVIVVTVAVAASAVARGPDSANPPPEGARELLDDRPGLVGTVVADRTDERFPMPVDLVIETPEELAGHNDQAVAHPEWFDGLSIGVTDNASGRISRDEQAAADRAKAPPPEPRSLCSRDLGVPSPGVVGRWLPCFTSGDAGSYFVAAVDQPSRILPMDALTASLKSLTDPVPAGISALGYYNPGEGLASVQTNAFKEGDTLVVDLVDDRGDLASRTRSGALDFVNSLISTVLQHATTSIIEIRLDGSCAEFEAWSEIADCHVAASVLQPRESE